MSQTIAFDNDCCMRLKNGDDPFKFFSLLEKKKPERPSNSLGGLVIT